MRRFLVPPGSLGASSLALPPAEAEHARRVLRLKAGDEVELLDGAGFRTLARISRVDINGVICETSGVETVEPVRPSITLCPGLLKGQAMDNLAVKFTELAVSEMRPFASDRTVGKVKDAKARLERWQRLAGQSLKQCGAAHLPVFHAPVEFGELLRQAPLDALKILLYENQAKPWLADALAAAPGAESIWLVVGPEGGFAGADVEAAKEAGFLICGLPCPTLRAETASLAAACVARLGIAAPKD